MCGIIGYVGSKQAAPLIKECLLQLEYRGYDSAGIAVSDGKKMYVEKNKGRVKDLEIAHLQGNYGIGHTRWATHGIPNKVNAHPHSDCENDFSLVHNGVIENYLELKERLFEEGHKIISDTDTELIAHLIEDHFEKGEKLLSALESTIKELKGSYAIALISKNEKRIYFARKYSPLIIGIGEKENFLASDIPALLHHTKKFLLLNDEEYGMIDENSIKIFKDGKEVAREPMSVKWDIESAKKGGYEHFTIKEIYEQPKAIKDTLADVQKEKIHFFDKYDNIHVVGCGTAFYAGMVFKYLMQKNAGIPVEAILANEYVSSHTPLTNRTLVFAISQSGETADTLSALRYAKQKGAHTAALVNVLGSSMTRIVDNVIYTHAGPEISVVSTKAFSAQVAALSKIAFTVGQNPELLNQVNLLDKFAEGSLKKEGEMKKLAEKLYNKHDFFFIGRGICYPVALEGALKLKEISYSHAEGYPAGELKHGPLSILEKDFPVFAIAPSGEQFEKTVSNIKECAAREASLFVLSDQKLNESDNIKTIRMEGVPEELSVIPYIIPLQLFAYHVCLKRGLDPDKPRNLAKSVTVE